MSDRRRPAWSISHDDEMTFFLFAFDWHLVHILCMWHNMMMACVLVGV